MRLTGDGRDRRYKWTWKACPQQMGVCCEDGCQNDATWAWKTVKKTGQTHRVKNGHAECHDCWKAKDSAAAAKRRRM